MSMITYLVTVSQAPLLLPDDQHDGWPWQRRGHSPGGRIHALQESVRCGAVRCGAVRGGAMQCFAACYGTLRSDHDTTAVIFSPKNIRAEDLLARFLPHRRCASQVRRRRRGGVIPTYMLHASLLTTTACWCIGRSRPPPAGASPSREIHCNTHTIPARSENSAYTPVKYSRLHFQNQELLGRVRHVSHETLPGPVLVPKNKSQHVAKAP